MQVHIHGRGADARRRGVVAVQVVLTLVVLLGFAALSVDLGAMYNAKGDLQRAGDASALAAASRLSDWSNGDPADAALAAAVNYAQLNPVLGRTVTLDTNRDVQFGRAILNTATGLYDFTPTNVLPDAVRVRLRLTDDSPNGAMPLYFARIFGLSSTEMQVESIAMMSPRDISIVVDLSASHNDDSELRNYKLTDVNLYDVWDILPGGIDEIGSSWDPSTIPPEWYDPQGNVAQAAGPGWGFFRKLGYGTDPVTATYDPTSDGGLVELPYRTNWTNAQLENALTQQGYIPSEVNAIMSSQYDGYGAYDERVATALGLAFWNSGQRGGLWQRRGVLPENTGNGNNWVGSGELEWTERVFDKSLADSRNLWRDYINSYMRGSWSRLYRANNNFKYRFGIKTFVNYLMERRPSNSQTPEFANVPAQPMEAVKDAVNFMVQYIDSLDTDDQLSLEAYGTTGYHEVDLTHTHVQVSDRLNAMQAGYYTSWTNMGAGLQRAINELTSTRARKTSRKIVILLTDGNANVNSGGGVNDVPGGNAYALDRAQAAAALGVRIFAVSVGVGANQSLMRQIADIGDGEHFHAEGSIEQYSAQLAEIFRRIGGTRPVELIQ